MEAAHTAQQSISEPTMPDGPPLQARGNGHMTRCNIAHSTGLDGRITAWKFL